MKKFLVASLLAISIFAVASNRGGFSSTGKNISVSKISQKNSWTDDQHIILEGTILRQVGKDDFVFKDSTGELIVEIDDDAWKGETITPDDRVRVYAEVDKSWKELEVEVYKIEKIK